MILEVMFGGDPITGKRILKVNKNDLVSMCHSGSNTTVNTSYTTSFCTQCVMLECFFIALFIYWEKSCSNVTAYVNITSTQ